MKLNTRSVPRVVTALAGSLWLTAASISAQAPATAPKTPQGTPGKVASRPLPRPSTAPAPKPPNSLSRLDVRRPPGVRVARPGAGTGAISSRSTSIQGAAWHSDNTPVPKAVLRLRNVVTGKIEATTIANNAGNFAFAGIPDGTYLIEMVSEGGKVMMIGHTFTVAPGETVATFVRLGPKVPWFNGFFGNAAQTVSTTAASTGVTAVAPGEITPLSSSK